MAVSQSLKLSQVRQDIPNKKSYVRILWESTQSGTSHNDNQRTAYYWVTINGVETRYSVQYTLPQNTKKVILDKIIECAHDASGKCTVRVRTEMDTRISAGVIKKNALITPTDIPVGGIVSAGEQYIGSKLRILVSGIKEEQICELHYSFGSLTGLIAEGLGNGGFDWTLPDSFYYEMPDTTKKAGVITCITYENGVEFGRSSISFTAVVGDAAKPEIIFVNAKDINEKTIALTGDELVLVKGFSTAQIIYIYSGSIGASIVKEEILCGDGQKAADKIINNVKSGQFQITITDSRGMTAKRTFTQLLIDYMPVTCNLAAKGIDEVSGAIPAVISGACFSGSFGVVQNSFQLEYWIKEKGGEWQQGLVIGINYSENNKYLKEYGLPGYDYNKTYLLKFKVSDYLTEAWSSEVKVKTIPVFDWGETDFNFNVPPIVSIPETGKKYNVLGACRALSESFNPNTSITPGENYSECTGGATLLGNCLRLNFTATRKSNPSTGNISDETIATFSINHGGKIGAVYATHFPIIQGQGTGNIINVSNSDGVLTLDLRLTGIETATTSLSSYFVVPVRLNLDYFI